MVAVVIKATADKREKNVETSTGFEPMASS